MMQLAEPTAESATDTSRPPRHYLPEDFAVTDWATIEPFFQELQARPVPRPPTWNAGCSTAPSWKAC